MIRRAVLATAAALMGACSAAPVGMQPPAAAPVPDATAAVDREPAHPSPAEPEVTVVEVADDELAAAGVNELGRVLVVEWHDIGDRDGRWENSLATFRAQLRELYDRGYRPISVDEFIDGTFPIPLGRSPVLLTFDDSYRQHFFFADDGHTPHPDSVVGILQAMEREDPTWRARATFAFYWPVPFRDTDRDTIEAKLRYLVANGFDLSNHTYNHDNLAELTDAEVQDNLARAEAELAEVVGTDYRVRSITLTQGIWPNNRELAMRGEANGVRYEHDIALLVGFMPTRSPHHSEYDPMAVQRVQAYVPEFDKWVEWLDAEPGRRFVSDGDPATVSFPASWADVARPLPGLAPRSYAEASAGAG
ncbi:MAG: polysaccharide deacetylase family protein [Actinobacteria bacterium]|nr:polysaccharide deacetylase family protein [Actinomycetota bacterium]